MTSPTVSHPARVGSSTRHRAEILNSPIPQGRFGRPLTSSELAALRAAGWHVSRRHAVVRQVANIDHLGIVYASVPDGGLTHAGIYVDRKGTGQ